MSSKQFSTDLGAADISETSKERPAYSRETESLASTLIEKQQDQKWNSESHAAVIRTLHLYVADWRHKHIHILDHDRTTPLYEVESHIMGRSKNIPSLTTRSSSTGSVVGTARCHTFKKHVDMTVSENAFPLTSQGVCKSRYSFTSPSLHGLSLTWKAKGLNINYTCEDEKGVLIAALSFPTWTRKKIARLELFDSRVDQDGVLDEIVVTGVTIVKMREICLSSGVVAAIS